MSTLVTSVAVPDRVRARTPAEPFSKQIAGLDLLRIVAAALVVVYHLCFYDWTARANSPGLPLHDFAGWSAFTSFGWVGVEIFFVISGFVIAYSAQGARPVVFAVQRLVRLLPAALLCGTVSAVALFSQGIVPLGEIARLWARSVALRPMPGIDGSYWTLPIELAFYGLVFLLLMLGQVRRLPQVMGVVGVVSTSLWVLTPVQLRLPAAVYRWYFVPLERAAIETQTLVWYGSSFAVGVFLWLCLKQRCTWGRLLMLGVCSTGTLLELLLRGNSLAHECGTRYRPGMPAALWLGSVGFIVVATRYNAQMQQWMGRRWVAVSRRLGMVTYPLYLLHHTVGFTLIQRLRPYVGATGALLTAVALVSVAAFLIAMYPEAAVQRWARQRIRRWTEAPVRVSLTRPRAGDRVVPEGSGFPRERPRRLRSTEASAVHPVA